LLELNLRLYNNLERIYSIIFALVFETNHWFGTIAAKLLALAQTVIARISFGMESYLPQTIHIPTVL